MRWKYEYQKETPSTFLKVANQNRQDKLSRNSRKSKRKLIK